MRYRRLGYIVPIALACLVAGLSGCSERNNSPKNQAADGKTTITLWWNVAEGTEDDPRSAGWYRLINTYMKKHPDIRIKTQSLPYEQLKQKLTNSLMAGNPPDVVSGLNSWLSDLYRMDALP
ncbi:ABC transporter substrate-binding protein, partial [Salinisphaera sp.]|uniref:ABC transporter substrate-binding protein n=1 Tax=Salinisphaera sp. TaxID=1914330 RepID=UPI002D76EBC9